MSFLYFIIIGGLAGFLAGNIYKGKGLGILRNIIVGIIGGFVGGFLFGLVGITATGIIGSLISATIGAIVLLWLAQKLLG